MLKDERTEGLIVARRGHAASERERGGGGREKRRRRGEGEERDNGLNTPPGCENAPNFRTNAVSIYGWLLQKKRKASKRPPATQTNR